MQIMGLDGAPLRSYALDCLTLEGVFYRRQSSDMNFKFTTSHASHVYGA